MAHGSDAGMDADPPTIGTAAFVQASIALPERHEGLATAALRGCLQQRVLDRHSDRAVAGRLVLDWLTFRVQGPDQHGIPGPGTWFVYTATAQLRALDPAQPATHPAVPSLRRKENLT